jgi:hypothetical protein
VDLELHTPDQVRASAFYASNAKAKRELGWTPRHPSWRQGFDAVYATQAARPRMSSARHIFGDFR